MKEIRRSRAALLGLVVVVALAAGSSTRGADAASSTSVVSATVPSATSIDITGCPANTPAVTRLGAMVAGSSVVTSADCTVSFGSSNQTASLQLSEWDGGGRAMHRTTSGEPDSSFGVGGSVSSDLAVGGSVDSLEAVVRQTDGKLLVGGTASGDGMLVVLRMSPAGALDPTWGTAGIVRFSMGLSGSVADLELQPDGKVLVLGTRTSETGSRRMFVRRLTPSGATDATYGSGGSLVLPRIGTSETGDTAVEAQLQSGKLIVAGQVTNADNDFAAARVDANGVLDTSFGSGGIVQVDIRTNDWLYGMVVQSDDRIVIIGFSEGGTTTGNDLSLVRFDADGALDPSFGAAGKAVISLSSSTDLGIDVLQQPDGKLVIGGATFVGSSFQFVAARLTTAGALDTTFNGTGWRAVPILGITETDYGMGIGRQSDGSIVLTGSYRDGAWNGGTTTGTHLATVRFTPSGALDTTWGTGGTTTQTVGSQDLPRDLLVQPDDAVVVVGTTTTASDDLLAVRYTPSGSLDGTFASGGTYVQNVGTGGLDFAQGGIVLADGRLLSVGRAAGGFGVATATLSSAAGVPDTAWNGSGALTTSSPFGFASQFWSVVQQPDGKVVMAGTAYDGGRNVMWLQRRLLDGSLDPSFGSGGNVTVAVGTASSEAYDVDVQADGRIVLSGYGVVGGVKVFAVVRVTPTGALDPTFAANGVATVAFGTVDDIAFGLAIQPNGRIVVAGYSSNGANFDVAVARMTAFGELDGTFGTGGRTTSALGAANDIGRQLALQDDGKIVVSGYTTQAGVIQAVVVRYTSSGALDSGFGAGGQATVTIPGHPTVYARSLAIGAADTITIGGQAYNGSADGFFAMRLTSTGAPDPTFNGGNPATFPALGPGYARQVALGRDGQVALFGSTTVDGDAAAVVLSLRSIGSFADYVPGVTDFATGSSTFGVCLRATSGSTPAPGWVVDPAATCAASDAAPWRAVPDAATSIATTPTTGTLGATASFRFGGRAATNQPPGEYQAPLRFDVIAPGA